MLFFLLLSQIHLSEGANSLDLSHASGKWFGPSYQPNWWNPDDAIGIRGPDFNYEGNNCAFEGCMIGLSIGVVLGSIRAISLDGVPHSEDETPCKTLITHIMGGLISGALIGVVYVFFKECLFK